METDYNNFQVLGAGTQPWTSVNYTTTQEGTVKMISFVVVSEYEKPLVGDLFVTFTEANPVSLGSPMEYGYIIVGVVAVAVAAVGAIAFMHLAYFRKFNRQKVKTEKQVSEATT